MTRNHWKICLALAAGSLASVAWAGPEKSAESGAEAAWTTTHVSTQDGDERYEVVIRGDQIEAKINGMRVAPDHIRREGRRVILLDDDGNEVKSIVIATPPGASPAAPSPGSRFWSFGGEAPSAMMVEAERPPVMLGVILGTPGEALQAQLGVDEHAILIERVLENLPAAKAGLERWDIVTAINGDEVDEPGELHGVLMKSKPGDTLKLTVMRNAKPVSIAVELAGYDADALSSGEMITIERENEPFGWSFPQALGGQQQLDTAKEALEAARRQLQEMVDKYAQSGDMEAAKREIERAIRQLEMRGREVPRALGWFDDQGRLLRAPLADEQSRAIEAERAGRLEAFEAEMESRMADLEKRWQKLESMFERLLKKLDDSIEGEKPQE
jgi:hypothetical protein